MDLRCFVRVLPGTDGDPPGGTGYLLTCDRLLTAAHVVGNAKTITIQYDAGVGTKVKSPTADQLWIGDDACDVAVYKLKVPAEFEVSLPLLAETPIDKVSPWESRGWAYVSEDNPRVRDSMVDLSGSASQFLADQKRFQLEIRQIIKNPTFWRGISGAPVFEQTGLRRLLGVVAEAPSSFENVLKATPITLARKRAKFLASLGFEQSETRLRQVINEVSDIFRDVPQAAKALARTHGPWIEINSTHGHAAFAETLITSTDIVDAILRLNQAHRSLFNSADRKAAPAIEKILAHTTPLLIQRRFVFTPPGHPGCARLSLPASTITIAELLAAIVDGRPGRLRSRSSEFPDGQGRLPQPTGEHGFDYRGEATLESYSKYVETKFMSQEDRQWIKRKRARKEEVLDDIFTFTNDELEFLATQGDIRARHYFLFDREFERNHGAFLEALKDRLKSIHFFLLDGNDRRNERKICRPIRQILNRANDPKDEESE